MYTWLNDTVWVYPWQTAWPTILISCLIHGNEKVWEYIIAKAKKLLDDKTHTGTYIILLTNPTAYQCNSRFCDEDMNRCRGNIWNVDTIETRRAKEIIDWLKANNLSPDYIYDFHSTPSYSSPMIVCSDWPETRLLALLFDIPYRVTGLIEKIEWVSLLAYFARYGSVWLAFETWDHTSSESMQKGEALLQQIIDYHNGITVQTYPQISMDITDLYYTTDSAWSFAQPYQGFEKIPAGTIRYTDHNQSLQTATDKYIVIPNTRIAHDLAHADKTWIAYLAN
jgi:succinylglutamate desuccinylase